jgi:aspartate kinase
VVVAGFQGLNRHGEVTTLGRGGSDATAVALAAALSAQVCQIFSDVEGVYSADPRVVPEAQLLPALGYGEMYELARCGARVLNVEAVSLARRSQLAIQALSSFGQGEGTRICAQDEIVDRTGRSPVVGVAGREQILAVAAADPKLGTEVRQEVEDKVRDLVEEHEILLSLPAGAEGLDLLTAADNIPHLERFSAGLRESFAGVAAATSMGSVSAVGAGVGGDTTLLEDVQAILRRQGVAVHRHVVHPRSLTCVVPGQKVEEAMQALHGELVAAEGAIQSSPGAA